jgi:hypothetical protein
MEASMAKNALRYVDAWGRLVWPTTIDQLGEARAEIDAGNAQGIYVGQHPDGAYVPESLEDLRDFRDIKSIQFGRVPKLSSLGLEKFQCLEALWFEELEPFDIAALKNLRKLAFFASKRFDVGFRAPKLHTLLVSKSSVQSCQFVGGSKNLEYLSLIQCSKLTSLAGLEGLKNLSKVVLAYLPQLSSLAGIEKCPALESVELGPLRRVTDFTPAFQAHGLRSLIISKCNAIASLRPVTDLRLLEHLALIDTDVVDGDLHPILGISSLRHIGIFPAKKHFSPGALEVARVVAARTALLPERRKEKMRPGSI